MNRSTTFAAALTLSLFATALAAQVAAPPTAERGGLKGPNHPKPIPKLQYQVNGKIIWHGNVNLTPGSGDACSHFKLTVREGSKDVATAKGLGNMKQGSCTYIIGAGVPTGTPVRVHANYDGPLAGKADSHHGESAEFTLEPGKTAHQDIDVQFTLVK